MSSVARSGVFVSGEDGNTLNSAGTTMVLPDFSSMELANLIAKPLNQIFRISSGSFLPFKDHDHEKTLRINQARLARDLRKRPARRLLRGQFRTADSSQGKSGSSLIPQCLLAPEKLQMQIKPLQLIDVRVATVEGTIVKRKCAVAHCTLEAHVNGLRICMDRSHVDLMFANISESLLRLDRDRKREPAALLFLLRDSVRVFETRVDYIQILLQRVWDDTEQSWQSRDKEAVDFAHEVEENHRACRTSFPMNFKALEKFEFYGGSPDFVYALTVFALVVIRTPLLVYPLRDIEIVNLSHLKTDEFDMTIVFASFDWVLQIPSVPIKFLDDIKRRLNFGEVKFYVNEEKVKWDVLVRDIAKFPELFRETGGWDSLYLEDDLTLAYYQSADSDVQRDSLGIMF